MQKSRARVAALAAIWTIACGSGAAPDRGRRSEGEVELTGHPSANLQGDPLAARADSLVRSGRPWRATALLASRLAAPDGAAPEVRLAAARAAAAWDGWSEVDRVLRSAPWLDGQFAGEGRELLARSELERAQDARANATLALKSAADDESRITRHVLLARAFDRANTRDSAASHYLAAAARLPRVGDWLRLRAAGVTDDSAARAAIFTRVVSPAARARVASTDAQARERLGDFAGAARSYRRAGAEVAALRVESLAARDAPSRAAVVQRLIAYLGKSPATLDARQAIDVLDKMGTLTGAQELTVARGVASSVPARAVIGFGRASAAGALAAHDRMAYAGALARAGKSAEAIRIYAGLAGEPAFAPAAAYQAARLSMQAGSSATARTALQAVAQQFASNAAAAAPALLLLADLQVDDNDMSGAARSLHELTSRYPTASQAPLARFRAALIDFPTSPAVAAASFDSLAKLYPKSDEADAARYWSARALQAAGRKAEAASQWQSIVASTPLSYYAMRSAARLGAQPWVPPAGPDAAPHAPSVDSAIARITSLQQLGMDVEARFEMDALAAHAEQTPTNAAAVADAFVKVNEPSRALRVALAAIDRGQVGRSLFRAAYPVLHQDALVEQSTRNSLDPALVAGLIRQESSWNPHAVSVAQARGLMQLLPSVGASIATSRGYPFWNVALLFEPEVNLELGTTHLASSLRRDTPPERALAAYNAGASRLARWIRRPGSDDPELFTEWIPFTETRDYVRLVTRNASVYRALYGLK
jgi:soluble lytic murein transglycosylase